jgi:general secretion pathway protein F
MAVETEAIRHGSSLANALRRVPPLAGSLPGWVQAGEASGALAPLLEQAAQRYQQQWDRLIARALALLEPLLILLMGALVLLLALAILMPIMTMNNALQ